MMAAPLTRAVLQAATYATSSAPSSASSGALLVEAAAVPAEPVRAEHAVAGADDRDRVRRAGLARGAHGARAAGVRRQLRVGHRGAVGDAHHRLATGAVEAVRERPVELDVELLQLAGEVAVELVADVGQRAVVLAHVARRALAQVVCDALRRLARERQAQQSRGPRASVRTPIGDSNADTESMPAG